MRLNKLHLLWILAVLFACSNSSDSVLSGGKPPVQEEGGQVFIIDQTGKSWDVTHARDRYQMQPELFQYGLGPFSITPLINPAMLNHGDPSYPAADETFLVIGVNLAADPRAYPLELLRCHEIANEVYGDAHVAVAY